MSLVLDASAAIAWAHEEESTVALNWLFEQVEREGAWVPSLWRLEVANILELDVRKGRQPGAFRDRTLADLASLPIKIDPDTDFWAWSATLQLAARHRLTLYDAAYLELAVRLEVPLATLDQELSQAGVRENLIILGN